MKNLLCLAFTFLLFEITSKAQIGFQKIEYALFDVNSYRTNVKDSVFVSLYCTISKNGLILINNKDDYHEEHTYYSFKLRKSQLQKINSTFNSQAKLKSYLAKTKLGKNSFYAGNYDFYRVTYDNGTVDSICVIPPFMSQKFYDTYNLLDNIFFAKDNTMKINQFNIPRTFLNSLKGCYWKSKYLPEIKNPPPFILEKQN